MWKKILLAVFGVGFVGQSVAFADEASSHMRFGAGYFGVADDDESLEFHMEYQDGHDWWGIRPFAGIMANTDAAFYGYMGVRYDFKLTDQLILAPQFGPGIYTEGNSKDLGYALQFRSGIELAYEFENKARVGATLYHLSNASLGDANPGTEVFTLHYSQPIDSIIPDFKN